jgi:hypothetical protein
MCNVSLGGPYFIMRRDQLTIDYYDNFNNGSLNKYKKILKIKKNYRCVLLSLDLMIIQISYNFIIV